ncbi:MAG: F-box protein [Nitrososphaerota archaeon]
MLTIFPLDTVRAVFEFLDIQSLFKCRTLCKSMKYIIDHDFIIQLLIKTGMPPEQREKFLQNRIDNDKKELEELQRQLIRNDMQQTLIKAREFLEVAGKLYVRNIDFKSFHGKDALEEKDLKIIEALPFTITGGYIIGSNWETVAPVIKTYFPQLFKESSDPQNQNS